MTALLAGTPSWVTGVAFAIAMVFAWSAGWAWGRWLEAHQRTRIPSRFGDATIALLGLLLAFTFSLALSKHDQQRQSLATEASAIGDFYTCAALLTDAESGPELRQAIREYAAVRLDLANAGLDDAGFEQRLDASERSHDHMARLVRGALDARTPIGVPLVNTLNEVTSSHTTHLSIMRDRLPASIVIVLLAAALVAMAFLGEEQAATGERHLPSALGFIALISLVVWVTLDLNQPRRGLITVSQEPIRRLVQSMGGPSPGR